MKTIALAIAMAGLAMAAKAAIVTSQRCRSITRHRAAKLHIDVIELDDLLENRTVAHILSMMQKNSGA